MSVLKVTRAQPCISRAVAAQSGGSLAATASTCAWAGLDVLAGDVDPYPNQKNPRISSSAAQFQPLSSCRAITVRWIWLVPS
jgi:hypothetical protein